MDIKSILEKHAVWLDGDSESGECANLKDADLWGADLGSANLWGCNGNLTHIKSVSCAQYPVTYTADVMQIGCQRHLIADWWEFDNKTILVEMDGKTVEVVAYLEAHDE